MGFSVHNEIVVAEGGVTAWLTILGAWLVFFATLGYLYSFGVYQDFYTRFLLSTHTPGKIAWIGSLQLMMPFFLGAISGKLFDAGYFYVLEISGAIVFTVSLFLSSLVQPQSYYQVFLSQGVGMGLGLGLTFVPTAAIAVHHFKRRRALATGIALSGGAIGSVIFPISIHLIPSIGYAKTVRASACIVLGFLIIGNLLMRTSYPSKDITEKATKPDIKGFFTDPPYLLSNLGALLANFGIFFPMIYLQLYAIQHRIDPNLAFYSISLLNGMGAIGRVGGNFLADMYGPFNVFVPCTIINAGMIFAIFGIKTKEALIVFSIVFGLISGAWLSLSISGLATLARRPDEVGARTGIALAFSSFGALGAAPAQGSLLTDMFLWDKAIIFSGVCALKRVSMLRSMLTRPI
ncbi:MFS general substrate transporter [Pholiota conissans]|uniref:MFS general substrate transporter n=1 Tax=Pholiota conissans TaxID=109636 RepID=A0A9P6CRL5_9AGAR|nr:MFS general substrate transporter [Pholiota conissans]